MQASIYASEDVYVGSAFSCPPATTRRVHIVVDETVPGSGAVFVGGVYNNPIAGPVVAIDSSGKLGVQASSARFKDEIKCMDNASEAGTLAQTSDLSL